MPIQINDRYFKGHIALFGANLIFGLNTPISKALLGHPQITPFAVTFFRMTGAALLFWLVALMGKREPVKAKDLMLLFFASFFGIQLNQTAFYTGLAMTSPVDASVITTLVPILTMPLAALFLKEPVTWKKTIGVIVGAAGALLLILNSDHAGRSGASAIGDMFCMLSALSYAIYLTAFRNVIRRYSPVTVMKWMFLFAAVCTAPLCWESVASIDYASLPAEAYLQIAYVVIFATFISYMLIPVGQKLLRPTVVSMYNYMQPIVSSLVAVALGMDVFGWWKGGASLMVFAGVYIVMLSKSRAQVEAEMRRKHIQDIRTATVDAGTTEKEQSPGACG